MKNSFLSLFIVILLLTLSACTPKNNGPDSTIKFRLPSVSSNALQKSVALTASTGSDGWGVVDPTDSNDLKCFAILVEVPGETTNTNRCETASGEIVARPSVAAGSLPGGAEMSITVPSGSKRKFLLVGYNATDLASCGDILTGPLDRSKMSAPHIIASTEANLEPGDQNIELTVSLTNAKKFKDCSGPLFVPVVTTPAPTPTPGPSPSPSPSPTPAGSSLMIYDTTVDEASGTASFTIMLSPPSAQIVTANWTSVDGTAMSGTDYTSSSGTLTFAAGDTIKFISVGIIDDTLDEADEAYSVQLSGPTNATISDDVGIGTILDNDASPTLSIMNTSISEGSGGGTTNLTFTITAAPASGQNITVNYATSNGTATVADNDYVSTTGTATISAGSTITTFTVPVIRDAKYELAETMTVTLSGGSGYTSAGSTLSATGTINNDDSPPILDIQPVSVSEGAGTANFTLTLSAASAMDTVVSWSTADGTATAGADYNSTSMTTTIPAGNTSYPISVTINQDATSCEGSETFFVTLTTPTNATLGTSVATGTIDDDEKPTLTLSGGTGIEGGNVNFLASLSYACPSLPVHFTWSTSDGTANAGADYTAYSGMGTIAPGLNEVSLPVVALADGDTAPSENFNVTLSSPTNAVIGAGSATGTIVDAIYGYDFTTVTSLPAGLSFSRASTATYVKANGLLVSAAAGVPRFDHDPASKLQKGLLLESASTNFATYSIDFSQSAWTKTYATITPEVSTVKAPDGTLTADALVESASSVANHMVQQVVAATSNNRHVASVYVHAADVSTVEIRLLDPNSGSMSGGTFDLSTGTKIGSPTSGSDITEPHSDISNMGNGWYRIFASGMTSGSVTSLAIQILAASPSVSYAGTPGKVALYLWGAQVESNRGVPTSFIETASVGVLRDPDILTASSPTWFSAGYWTTFVDFSRPFYEPPGISGAGSTLFTFGPNATLANSNYIAGLNPIGGLYITVLNAGGQTGHTTATSFPAPTADQRFKMAFIRNASTVQLVWNGQLEGTSSLASGPAVDTVYLGGVPGSRSIEGHLKRFLYWDRSDNAMAGSLSSP